MFHIHQATLMLRLCGLRSTTAVLGVLHAGGVYRLSNTVMGATFYPPAKTLLRRDFTAKTPLQFGCSRVSQAVKHRHGRNIFSTRENTQTEQFHGQNPRQTTTIGDQATAIIQFPSNIRSLLVPEKNSVKGTNRRFKTLYVETWISEQKMRRLLWDRRKFPTAL